MPLNQTQLADIKKLLSATDEDIITPSSPNYSEESKTWSAQRNLDPAIVVKPKTIEQLSGLVKYLFDSSLDFAIRGGGVGSVSARDVLIKMDNFKNVEIDEKTNVVTVGGGCLWGEVNEFMAKYPSLVVPACRSTFLGVVGSVINGGYSWMSHKYGLCSDPDNLLDAQIVLGTGEVVWASEQHPDLLWALRGGRSPFGAITALKFQAREYETENLFGGFLVFLPDKLKEISAACAKHIATNKDPKVAFQIFILNPKSPFFDSPPGVGLQIFDGHGEEHARSEAGFKWAYDFGPVADQSKVQNYVQVNQQADVTLPAFGNFVSHDTTVTFTEFDPDFLVRANEWFYRVLDADPSFPCGSYCIIEINQEASFNSTKSEAETAWPHSGHKHILQIGVGYLPKDTHLEAKAFDLLRDGLESVPKTPTQKKDVTPLFPNPWLLDPKETYGANFPRLYDIAEKYDPKRRWRTIFSLGRNWM